MNISFAISITVWEKTDLTDKRRSKTKPGLFESTSTSPNGYCLLIYVR